MNIHDEKRPPLPAFTRASAIQMLHTFTAGSIGKDFYGHADCRSCNLKQTDVDALIDELAKMGSVEKLW